MSRYNIRYTKVAFIKKSSPSGELVVVWASSSGVMLLYFSGRSCRIVLSYSGK